MATISIGGSGGSVVTLNGRTIVLPPGSRSVSMVNNKLFVNGVEWKDEAGAGVGELTGVVELKVEGDLLELRCDRGSVSVTGGVGGDVKAGTSVTVGHDVNGNVDAGSSVEVKGSVGGNVDARSSVTCGDVGGDVDAGTSVRCGKVAGSVDAGGSVRHG